MKSENSQTKRLVLRLKENSLQFPKLVVVYFQLLQLQFYQHLFLCYLENRNIFYASNVQSHLFPQNTRSKFENYINFQHLNYIDEENIKIGIKSISIDNNKNFQFTPDESNPHMILIERGKYMQEQSFYTNIERIHGNILTRLDR